MSSPHLPRSQSVLSQRGKFFKKLPRMLEGRVNFNKGANFEGNNHNFK